MKKLSWTPIRRGRWTPIRRGRKYCSPACGLGCTKAEHTEAKQRAKKLASVLGPGWKPIVTENLGWHAKAESSCGRWKVHADSDGTFTAFLGDRNDLGGIWGETGRTPRSALKRVWAQVKHDIDYYNSFLDAQP